MDSSVFRAFFFILLIVPCLCSAQCEFPALFNFGDSNSDTGSLTSAFQPVPPPNGLSFFGGPAGRFCDGRLIIDFIAEALGLPYLNAYLDSVGTNFTHGANFASAGSTIRRQTARPSTPFSLDVQSRQFDQFITRSQAAIERNGVYKDFLPDKEYFSRALYTFDMGQNDLSSGAFRRWNADELKTNVSDILDKFTTVIKDVYWRGGRYFWVHNTGPLGCLPFILESLRVTTAQVDDIHCVTPVNENAQYFNGQLKERVNQLRKEFPSAAFTYVDVYSVKYNLIHNAKKYGFEHPLRVCCGHGGKYNYNSKVGCGGKITVNGTEILIGKSCSNPSTAVSWDGIHYSQAANEFVFDQIVNGAYSDPPVPLRSACQGK